MRRTSTTRTQRRIRILLGCTTIGLFLVSIAPRGAVTQNQHPQIPDAVKQSKIKYAKGVSQSVRKIRKMLNDARVSLEASDLFSENWHRRVSAYSGVVPDLTKTKKGSNKLKGVNVADTLILPENVELTDDTLIIARQVVFLGKHVVIKGNHDLHFFQNAPPLSMNDGVQAFQRNNGVRFLKAGFSPANSIEAAKEQGLLVVPESWSINVDGYGREQWLEDQKKKEKNKTPGLRAAHVRGVSIPQQNADGADKTGEGPKGDDGTNGVTPNQASMGVDGDCATNPDGGTGTTGQTPSKAGTGHTGGWGANGEDGHTLTFKVELGVSSVSLSAKGGEGQRGGPGGDGGLAARGGQGGTGGPGKVCNCPGRSGNGGRGGTGGPGGQGGDGGPGGTGGDGGTGGTINLIKPCDFTNYSTNVNGGVRGPAGNPGRYRAGGQGGLGGPGGTPAINGECGMQGGVSLGTGPDGEAGPPGDRDGESGTPGEPGHSGQVNPSTYGNCGGGPDYPDIQPSYNQASQTCTMYDWVWIHCDFYVDEESASYLSQKYAPTVKANHYVRSLVTSSPRWECYEADRWPAGCF